jgi:hypothetical protein
LTTPKIPLNTFAIPLGLAGLGEVWTVLGSEHHAPALVGDVIMLIAAAAWVAIVAAYLSYLITTAAPAGKAFSADFLDRSDRRLARWPSLSRSRWPVTASTRTPRHLAGSSLTSLSRLPSCSAAGSPGSGFTGPSTSTGFTPAISCRPWPAA